MTAEKPEGLKASQDITEAKVAPNEALPILSKGMSFQTHAEH